MRKRQGHRYAEGTATGKPPRGRQGTGGRPRVEKGVANRHGNGSSRRNAARGAGTSVRGWRAADAGDIQVGGDPHWGSRWGVGES